jgi:hypothetical protein
MAAPLFQPGATPPIPIPVRGTLQIGGFRTYRELNRMSHADHRNTLITELAGRTNQSVEHYQSLHDEQLAGAGAVLVFIRQAGIRDDADIKGMSDDDLRNTVIVELNAQTGLAVPELQGMSNRDLILLGLGKREYFIRGTLQIGGFRTYRELNRMSHADHRNTLITELAGRTNQSVEHYQSLHDEQLAGAGAVLVFIRQAGIRDDADIKGMSDDDLRNTLITEMEKNQAGNIIGVNAFQRMGNLDLVADGLSRNPQFLH